MKRVPVSLVTALLLAPALSASAASAQDEGAAFADAQTLELFRTAQEAWRSVDDAVVRYTALVKQRMAAALRTPLRDRTIFQAESAARIFWDRDHDQLTQVLASSTQLPGPADVSVGDDDLDFAISDGFDPGGDRLVFGFASTDEADDIDEDDYYIVHPLGSLAEDVYRFEVGDTLTLTLPDARELRAVELSVVPRQAGPNFVTGTLWIEPTTGALVRAVYRLSQQLDIMRDIPDVAEEEADGEFRMVPGFLKPWTFDMTLVTVDYTLWDFEVWLPRAMRVEGQVRVGILKVPAEVDISYRIESVVTERDLLEGTAESPFGEVEERVFESREAAMAFVAERLGAEEGVEFEVIGDNLVPVDREWLRSNPNLPPPIWEDAPGFLSQDDVDEFEDLLGDLPRPPVQAVPLRLGWGLGRPDALRYNRIEALSAGVAGDARFGSFLGPIDVEVTALFGVADLMPKGGVTLTRNTFTSSVALSGYHDLQAVEPRGRHLELGSSLMAFLFGRDDGEYYLASGGDLTFRPAQESRQTWEVRLYGERQRSVETNTDVAVSHLFDSSWRFRPNVVSDELDEFGAELRTSPWWGRDPEGAQAGLELYGHVATWTPKEGGERAAYGRARATLRTRIPVTERWRVGFEAEAGTAFDVDAPTDGVSAVPSQRNWFVGGAQTLRGYDASVLRGEDQARARLELARGLRGGSFTVFGDAGWAGTHEDFVEADVLYAVGVGASLLDGLVRIDLSRGVRGPLKRTRLDVYLDAIL
jgi:hypothetical protein